MELTKYLGSVAIAAFISTAALGDWEVNSEIEGVRHDANQHRLQIITSFYDDLKLKNVVENATPKKLTFGHELNTPLNQELSFDFGQPLTSQNVAKAIATFLHVGDTPEALLICQKIEAVFQECDYDKRAAKREAMKDIFKAALSLIEDEKQIKPKLQLTFQEELSSLETRMNQGLEKALKFSHERQQPELLLALDAELDSFLQTRKKGNTKSQLISKKDLYNFKERTKGEIEEKFVVYAKNPPAPKRIQAIKQAEIRLRLDEEMDILKIKLKNQKDKKNRRSEIRTVSFYAPSSTEKLENSESKIINKRSWVIKAKTWEKRKVK